MISEEKHPSELNILQQYQHMVMLADTTSRLKNKDWYREALDLNIQVHCYIKDEGGATCYLHVKSSNHYENIGALNQQQLESYDALENFIKRVLSNEKVSKAKSIGIIMYLADEMSLASLGPEHQDPNELAQLQALMKESPKEALEDKTVSLEKRAWGLFPYPGAVEGSEFATAVAVPRKQELALQHFREIARNTNIPIRTAGVCAPLCALASLPWFSSTDSNGTVVMLNYQDFSLLAFFNSSFDLMLLRYMPHSNGSVVPANIGPAVLATAAAFELENPRIQIVPVSGQDVDPAIVSLQSSMMGSEILLVDPGEIMRNSNLPEDIPLEVLTTTQRLDPKAYPLATNKTFSGYQKDRWHVQNFLAPSREEQESRPSQGDMLILQIGRKLKVLGIVLLLAFVAYSGLNIWKKISSPEWQYKAGNSAATATMLQKEVKDYNHWENILKDRSDAWVSMELIARVVPEDGSLVLSKVSHRAVQKREKGELKAGIKKEWNITGYADDKGINYLRNLSSREGMKKLFTDVATATGNSAYIPDAEGRDITATLNKQTSNRRGSVALDPKLKNGFKLRIIQTFGSDDEMAISGDPVTK